MRRAVLPTLLAAALFAPHLASAQSAPATPPPAAPGTSEAPSNSLSAIPNNAAPSAPAAGPTPTPTTAPAAGTPAPALGTPAPTATPGTTASDPANLRLPAASVTLAGVPLRVTPGLEVIARYTFQVTNESGTTDWDHRFDLARAHASVGAEYGIARARITLEAVRSASEGALLGVAGDSLVFRVREASAELRPWPWLSAQAGVVSTLTITALESAWGLRAVAPTLQESTGLGSPADLGATARVTIPAGYGWVAAGVYNGDGYNNPELNRGKNLEVAAEVHPLAATPARPIALLVSYVNGSSGTGRARADRFTAGGYWSTPRLRAGVDFTYAWGVGDQGDQQSWLFEGFVRAEPVERLLLGARASVWVRNAANSPDDQLALLLATVGFRVVAPFEVFAAFDWWLPGDAALAALPGSDHWSIRAIAHVLF